MKKRKPFQPRPWRHLLPAGWKFRMSYDHRGDGSALFLVPIAGDLTRTYRIRAGWSVAWKPKVEAFGEAALRRLLEIHPELLPAEMKPDTLGLAAEIR